MAEEKQETNEEKTPRRSSRLRRWLVNLSLVAGGCLFALIVAEVILRLIFYFPQPQSLQIDEIVGHRHRPGVRGYYTEEGFSKYTVNSHGFLDREYDVARPPGVFRIALLGDSFTEAFQVNLDETFHEILEKRLEPIGGEVLNFGVSGFGTAQELLTYRHYARQFSPQLVILAFCSANDLSDNSKTLAGGYPRPYYHLRDGELVLDNGFRQSRRHRLLARFGPLYYFLGDHFAMVQCADKWRRNASGRKRARRAKEARKQQPDPVEPGLSRGIYGPPTTDSLKEAWELTERLLLEVNREVREDKARLAVMTVSVGVQVDKELREKATRDHPDWDLDYPDRRVEEFCERNEIPCLRTAPSLLDHKDRAGRSVHGFEEKAAGHWNAVGHQLVAEILEDFLRTRSLVPLEEAATPPSTPPE